VDRSGVQPIEASYAVWFARVSAGLQLLAFAIFLLLPEEGCPFLRREPTTPSGHVEQSEGVRQWL
jgi:hypothetical protein